MLRARMIIEGSPRGMAKQFGGFIKEGLIELVHKWHRKTMPGHFKNRAVKKYDYEARGEKYQKRKDRKHLGPLVFSGKSRQQLKQSIRVTATSKRAKGSFRAPRHFWMNPPGHPKKSEELVAVTQEEANQMAAELNKGATRKLNKVRDKRIVR
ncbi:MAG: hypothetical protein ACYSSI_10140 [Planctomycetota bacterium]|jgi:hypothetical protein